jgi:protein-histidine pros-kinase
MVDVYGPANGFGWKFHETVGAQVVSVPTQVAFGRAQKAFITFMGSLVAVLATIGVILNILLWRMFIRPVSRISSLADRISMGELEAPDLEVRSRDEIHTLAESLARMRKSRSGDADARNLTPSIYGGPNAERTQGSSRAG